MGKTQKSEVVAPSVEQEVIMRGAAMLVAAVLSASPLWADGMPDPGFGNGGRVITDFPPSSFDQALAVAVLPDGRIVAAGFTENLAFRLVAVARYLTSGALDTSFDGDGQTTISFGQTLPDGSASEVLLQPDGKIVLVGAFANSSVPNYALARLNADGSLDSSFGTGGKVTTPLPGGARAGIAAALQPDGRIVALGSAGFPEVIIALVRYNADGSLDGTFGTAGQVSVPTPLGVQASALALQPDGKILVAASTTVSPDFALVRLLPDGTLDTSFDGDGLVTSDFGGTETANSVALQPDGRIVVSGSRTSTGVDIALARYLSNGTLDTTFGTGGLATADSGVEETADGLVVQPDGKLLVAGFTNDAGANDFILARFNADGTHDTTFGTGGFLLTDFGSPADQAHALAISPDRLVAAGFTAVVPFGQDFAVARYIATTPVEATSFSVE
jgi:uncharacterized delta-60 repeat protein